MYTSTKDVNMKILHTSPSEITEITNDGLFGDCLFFSHNEYVMTASSEHIVYSLEIENVVEAHQLYDEEIIEEIVSKIGVSSDIAESLLDGSDSVWSHEGDADQDWWIQAKQGECAKKMGYEAVESEDEQGAVFIVPMLGRESDLVKIK